MSASPRMVGGITVAGLVTGTHFIEDIKISVPHQIAVYIPADLAYRSKDLWLGINQRRLFLLTGGSGLAVESNNNVLQAPLDSELDDIRRENENLKQQLEGARQQNAGLQGALQAMQGQLTSILRLLGKIESKGVLLNGFSASGPELVKSVTPVVPMVVGGAVPTFIPNDIHPEDAKTNIQADVTVGSSVADTVKALREARKRGS